ncbi:hypothetical protein [Microbacterium jejuense]|uniref:hypothetical protein n=1 Tax=Microbacterium jejuense TaxID=1263637 RepID=UPI0031EFC03D
MPTNGESEWDHEQRALLVAYLRVERSTGEYGEWLPDATDDRADPTNYDDPLRYYHHGPFTNWARKAIEDVRDEYRKNNEGVNMNGLFWTVSTDPPQAE